MKLIEIFSWDIAVFLVILSIPFLYGMFKPNKK